MLKKSSYKDHRKSYKDNHLKVPTKSEVIKECIKNVAKEYCENSSICGLKHLVDEQHHSAERAIWTLTLIGALIFSIALVWLTFQKFINAPLVTTQFPDGISVTKIVFPAVSICTTNRISKMKVTELARELIEMQHNSKYNEQQMLALLRNLGYFYEYQPQAHNVTDKLMALHKALGKYKVNELLKNLTPSCEDLLVKCSWDGKKKPCSQLFEFRLTMNGYCCAFNYLRDSSDMFDDYNVPHYEMGNKTGYDEELGLKVLIRFATDDDFYSYLPIKGAQLQFTDAYDFPDAPSGSYATQFISPAVETNVFISARYTKASRDIQHIPIRVRKCLFYDESPYLRFYTHSDCMLKCRLLFLMEKCNCIPFNMPKMKDVKTCDLSDLNCISNNYATSISNSLNDEGIDCPMCYPTCSKSSYSFEFNTVNINPEKLNKVPDNEKPDWLVGANFTSTAIVRVKYANIFASLYGQNVIMKWFDLFSNIGSTCGFVTGFSFVSVLEFVYYFTIKLVREVRTRQLTPKVIKADSKVDQHLSKKEEVSNSDASFRPLYWGEITRSIHTGLANKPIY